MTKNGLRDNQHLLRQLQTYLPTLQLKKSLLQTQVMLIKNRIARLVEDLHKRKDEVVRFCDLLSSKYGFDPLEYVKIKHIQKSYENIAGVDLPIFEKVIFTDLEYDLFNTPGWFDIAIEKLKQMITAREKIYVEEEKKRSLQKELKDVSIRVNLFEKILIPRTLNSIKKIRIFLNDQELAAISQAKVAKLKKVKA
ncbi:MAG: V-type ATP synthase subunit D [Candidatus Anoxychlamydiales bacterium]|nr:V-type ATP synthase subunit D [Candidatus Anoxychlamydiales bacterium]NGX36370.1 V-type ATP synthase subunit D [Candidatus Anoxychlamydiales bacterium]